MNFDHEELMLMMLYNTGISISSSWLKFMFSPHFPAYRGIALRGIALFL